MNQHRISYLIVAAILLGAVPAMAQQKRISPHETISAVFNGNRVTLVYGRPYSKDPKTGETRKIWGTLVPYGKNPFRNPNLKKYRRLGSEIRELQRGYFPN